MLKYWFDFLLFLFAAAAIVLYAKKGLLKSVVKIAKWILAGFVSYVFGGFVSEWFYKTVFYPAVFSSIEKKFFALYQPSGNFDVATALDSLPFFLRTESIKNQLAKIDGTNAFEASARVVSERIATLISGFVGYLAVFFVALLLSWIILSILAKTVDISPFTKVINHILGGVFGFLAAWLLIVVAVFVVKAFFANSAVAQNSFFVSWF